MVVTLGTTFGTYDIARSCDHLSHLCDGRVPMIRFFETKFDKVKLGIRIFLVGRLIHGSRGQRNETFVLLLRSH